VSVVLVVVIAGVLLSTAIVVTAMIVVHRRRATHVVHTPLVPPFVGDLQIAIDTMAQQVFGEMDAAQHVGHGDERCWRQVIDADDQESCV